MEVDRGFISPQFVTNQVHWPLWHCDLALALQLQASISAAAWRRAWRSSRAWRWTGASTLLTM